MDSASARYSGKCFHCGGLELEKMKCPYCADLESVVLESREAESGESIRRRRECGRCHKRFTTYEKVREFSLWVVKKDGGREPFDKEKVRRGLMRAIQKTVVTADMVDDISDRVEREMIRKGRKDVLSKLIGSSVLRKLRALDKVAWLRYASVYFEFEDLRDFEKAIGKLGKFK